MGKGKSLKIGMVFIILLVLIAILFFVWKTINDYEEKNLSDIILTDKSKFKGFAVEVRDDNFEVWESDNLQNFEELLNFFSKYKVQKVKEADVKVYVKSDEGLDLFLLSKGKSNSNIIRILENNVYIVEKGHYKVLNGPIDMEWIKEYDKKIQSRK